MLAVPLTALWVMPWGMVALLLMPFGLHSVALAPMSWGIAGLIWIAHAVAAWPDSIDRCPADAGLGPADHDGRADLALPVAHLAAPDRAGGAGGGPGDVHDGVAAARTSMLSADGHG